MVKKDVKAASAWSNEIVTVFKNMKLEKLKFKSKNLKYFFNTAINYRSGKDESPLKKVAMMGFNIPEELIIACGAKPVWILGGSIHSVTIVDDLLPRDMDPMVKSALGMVISPFVPRFQELDLVLTPIYSDSMRKVTSVLSKRFETMAVDIPSVKEKESSLKRWTMQMEQVVEKICTLTGQRVTKDGLVDAVALVSEAKEQLRRFVHNATRTENLLTPEVFLLILNTYYMTDDFEEWTNQLFELNNEIEHLTNTELSDLRDLGRKPKIALAGSSLLFPNMKIPGLLTDAGLDICNMEMEMYSHLLIAPEVKRKLFLKDMIGDVAKCYYEQDSSQAFTHNHVRMKSLEGVVSSGVADALIYHVIRGQVAVDCEYEKIENLFVQNGIPVLKIETDYNYQDVEQLRIRIEAFGEMLRSNENQDNAYRRIG